MVQGPSTLDPFLVETKRQKGGMKSPMHTGRPRLQRCQTSFSSSSKLTTRSLSVGSSPTRVHGTLDLGGPCSSKVKMSTGSSSSATITANAVDELSSRVNAWNFGISPSLTSSPTTNHRTWTPTPSPVLDKRQLGQAAPLPTNVPTSHRGRERLQGFGTIGDAGLSLGWNFPSTQASSARSSPPTHSLGTISPVERQRCLTFEPSSLSTIHGHSDGKPSDKLSFGTSGNEAEQNVRDIVNAVVDDDDQIDFTGYHGVSSPQTRRLSNHQIVQNGQNVFSNSSTRPSSLYTSSSSRTESASSITTMSPSQSRFNAPTLDNLDHLHANGHRPNGYRSEPPHESLFTGLSSLGLSHRPPPPPPLVDCDFPESNFYRDSIYHDRSSWPGQQVSAPTPISPHSSARRISASHSMHGLRSPVLEEFRHDRVKKWELRDIFGHVVEFSGDQHGSRFIQQKMEVASSDERQRIFEEILPNARQLMQDVFGNYVCQKFFEHGHQIQKQILAKQIEGHVLNLSLGMYGCRVVQKALEHVLVAQQTALVSELDGHVLRCVRDQNANHVIQRAIERCPPESVDFIVRTFHGQVYALSGHPYGCRVLQRIFEHSPESQTRRLLDELHQHVENLVIDQYGNYVIQHVIANGQEADRRAIFGKLYGQIVILSKHKFASNVIEKCIMFGSAETQYRMVTEFIAPASDGSSPLFGLINDRFGNYVVQKMLDEGRGEARQILVDAIRPQLADLRKYGFGRHLSAIERSVNETPCEPFGMYHNLDARTSKATTTTTTTTTQTPYWMFYNS